MYRDDHQASLQKIAALEGQIREYEAGEEPRVQDQRRLTWLAGSFFAFVGAWVGVAVAGIAAARDLDRLARENIKLRAVAAQTSSTPLALWRPYSDSSVPGNAFDWEYTYDGDRVPIPSYLSEDRNRPPALVIPPIDSAGLDLSGDHVVQATYFDVPERDPFNSGGLACLRGRPMRRSDRGVASWHIPCGTRLELCLRGKCDVTRVIDRGPRRSWREHPEDLDLTRQTAVDLGFDLRRGWESVTWRVLP